MEGWRSIALADVCTIFTDGDWIETKDQSQKGIRLIQTGNVGVGEFKARNDKARFISEKTFERLKCQEIFEGYCLVSRLPEPVGRSCILPRAAERMITAVDCTIIQFDQSVMMPTFFHYYSQTVRYLRDVDAKCTGATRKRISRKNLGRIKLPIPPLAEQKRIVAILDEAFEGIERAVANAEKNLANARDLFEAYLNAVTKERHHGDRTILLGDACERITVGHVGSMASKYVESGVTFLRSQNIRPFEIDLTDVKFIGNEFHSALKKSSLRPGDVAIVRTGYPGTAAVVPEELGIANCADLVIATPKTELLPDYLAMLLNSRVGRQIVAGNLTGAAQKHFNVTAAKGVLIQLPAIEVQRRAVERFVESATFCRRLETQYQRKAALLAQLKQSLLKKAFSGELTAQPDRVLQEAVA